MNIDHIVAHMHITRYRDLQHLATQDHQGVIFNLHIPRNDLGLVIAEMISYEEQRDPKRNKSAAENLKAV